MNFLQSIHIDGVILSTYAALNIEIAYENKSSLPIRIVYPFSLPPGAEISGFKIVHDGHILRSKAVPIRLAESTMPSSREIVLLKTGENAYTLITQGFSPAREVKIVLEVFCPLAIKKGRARLTLPLGGGQASGDCGLPAPRADINLCISDNLRLDMSSPSHPELNFQNTGELHLRLIADRDFVLDIAAGSCGNMAYTGGNILGKCGIFFLTAPHFKTPKTSSPVIFIPILAGCSLTQSAQAKNTVYLAAGVLGDDADFAVLSDDENNIFHSIKYAGENHVQRTALAEFLKAMPSGSCSIYTQLLKYIAYRKNHKAGGIVVTNKDLSPAAAELLTSAPESSGLFFITFGDKSDFPYLNKLSKTCGIGTAHIYPGENMMASVRRIINAQAEKLHNIKISTDEPGFTLMPQFIPLADSGETLCFAAAYGEHTPEAFRFSCEEGSIILTLDKIENYDSFRFAEIFYACRAAEEAEKMMETASFDSIKKLKEKLEQTGVRYNCLNTETILLLEDPSGASLPVALSSPIYSRSPFTNEGTGIFSERSEGSISRKRRLLHDCFYYLLRHIHSDGSVSTFGEHIPKIRAKETLFAAAALSCLVKSDERFVSVFTSALAYLDTYIFETPVLSGAHDALKSQNCEAALHLLKSTLPDLNTLKKNALTSQSVSDTAAILLRILKPGGNYEGIL